MAAIRRTRSRPLHEDETHRLAGCPCTCERLDASVLHAPVWQLRLAGPVLGEDGPGPLVSAVAELAATGPVLIDLSDATVVRPDAVADALERASDPDEPFYARVAAVCPRATGRRLLRQAAPSSSAVFASQGDALQVLIMAGSGLGPGWAPDRATSARPAGLRLV